MIIQIRVKRNCPKTYLEKITRDKYMAYIGRAIGESEIGDIIMRMVSKEFFTPPQKIVIEDSGSTDKIVEILS
jgi:hypothetical protein